jgi:hypothetical protein
MVNSASTVAAIRELIARGHYRDEVPGRPGVALDGGGMFVGDRRIYYRGTSEFAEAAAKGLLDQLPPPPPPAPRSAVEEAESLVGAPMPGLLKDLYAVANGGFGPGYGVLGLKGGFADDMQRTAADILGEVAKGYWPGIPAGLLPLCHWGCAIYSFVHCPSGTIFGWDPNPVDPDDDVPFFAQEYSLDSWLQAWLSGTLLQPLLIVDESGRKYRGATISETRAAMDETEF